MIRVEQLTKSFVLHNQGGVEIPVFADIDLEVTAGECLVLAGPSGVGKSTLLRSLHANYLPNQGRVFVRHRGEWVNLAVAEPRTVLDARRHTVGHVSQFLRAIPRVPAIDLVAEPMLDIGIGQDEAIDRAAAVLARLNLPEALWRLPPATFSGGEQQRVNIAITFARDYPILLLDEPTASLDAGNRAVVIEMIQEATANGAAVVGIFHDRDVREAVGTREFDLREARPAA